MVFTSLSYLRGVAWKKLCENIRFVRNCTGSLKQPANGRLSLLQRIVRRSGSGSKGNQSTFHIVALSLAWPMTVSAWSFSKSEPGIPLRNPKDKQLLKDVEAADEMYKSGEMSRNEEILNKLLVHKDKNEPELQWRLSRAIYEKSKSTKDNEKKTLVELAYATVQKALALEDNCFGAHKWKAIILNEYSSLQGTKEKIMESYNIKFHMERALELNPNDPTTWYLLGQWCFSVADIPWYQRKIAAAVFSTPPSSTFEEALEKFQRAEDIQPLFYSMNLLMLVKTHLKLGNHEKASEYLEKLATLQMKTDEDFTARKEASDLRHQIRL